jgi:DNA-binding transcriptional LysR family regulator
MGQSQRYKELQLPQLRSFCLAATEGNFTSAARALGLAASTVWQQVRAL